MKNISMILFFSLLSFACDPAEEKENPNDIGTSDAGNDMRKGEDTSIRPDVSSDAETDVVEDAINEDMGTGRVLAIVGERCEPKERMGIVVVGRARQLNVYGSLFDAPNPMVGEPATDDGQCSFHTFKAEAPCNICEENEICNAAGRCLPRPQILSDAQIKISNDADSRTIVTNNGGLSDSLALEGSTFSMEVSWSGQSITVPQMEIPADLSEIESRLDGSYDQPEGLEFGWKAPENTNRVFTRIDINHHVNEPTFVECDVSSDAEKLEIAGEMLKPLAVSTGLEFQSLEHVQFAAADTPAGCVEFRFQSTSRPSF